ncbi:3'(2'),5'-bisphosphate nucleotidase CysQ [Zunongwangia pacifica]|uniref:3'(2'),5'-bisphosphate nucleotidase CysQ n=1 Tax=Zunongwangia pacifica TaxID=2911062 RepID=A0A9X2CJT9_9FLAO|nr:3'(2'),5'-bisphosphate nucleotidase CysQ [Zunongwangia pacifica]
MELKNNYLDIALQACFKASEAVMNIYKKDDFGVQWKVDDSPLTKADLEAHNIIKMELSQTGLPILSEEGRDIPFEERKSWETLWIVDPIDGTKEFIKRSGEFTINIALVTRKNPVLGVVYAPALGIIYWNDCYQNAYKLQNVYSNADFNAAVDTANVLPLKKAHHNYIIATSKSHLSEKTKDFIKQKSENTKVEILAKGSSLKMCMVAEGAVDCYPRLGTTMEWDTAAAHAICLSAKKNIRNYTTNLELSYNKETLKNDWFLAK